MYTDFTPEKNENETGLRRVGLSSVVYITSASSFTINFEDPDMAFVSDPTDPEYGPLANFFPKDLMTMNVRR